MKPVLAHLLMPLLVVCLLLGAGYGLNYAFGDGSKIVKEKSTQNNKKSATDTAQIVRISLYDSLYQELGVLKKRKAGGRGENYRPEEWTLPNGISLPNYALKAMRLIQSYGALLLSLEEQERRGAKTPIKILRLEFADSLEHYDLALRVADSTYVPGSSKLAVVFQVSHLTDNLAERLNKLGYPVTLLVMPFDTSQSLFAALDQVKQKEVVAWIPMQAETYTNDPARWTIKIQDRAERVQGILAEALRRLPEAKGIATRSGGKVVKQEGMMDNIVGMAKSKRLYFMDLTGERKLSRVQASCQKKDALCLTLPPNQRAVQEYLKRSLGTARRHGSALVLLPLKNSSLDALAGLRAEAEKQGTEMVSVSLVARE
jgi:polysaccharide deacetylase 2 family uncharacterized protein YibQ